MQAENTGAADAAGDPGGQGSQTPIPSFTPFHSLIRHGAEA